ncbi:hypothetical protein PybrP1_011606, partial [[Pythium] brassicae (nom. inval.)]
MSFVNLRHTAEAPALSLEETLALLDAFGSAAPDDSPLSCTETSSSGGCSPEDAAFDDLDELLTDVPSVWDTSTTTDDSDASSPSVTATGTPSGASNSESDATGASAPQRPTSQRWKRKSAPRSDASMAPDTEEEDDDEEDDAEAPKAESAVRKRRPRKQPKTEILRLRDEANELQMRLLQLQKGTATASSGAVVERVPRRAAPPLEPPRAGASWLDIAVDQFKALQRAEELNEKLKAEVARQTRFGATLKTQFTKKIAQQQGATFVQALEPAPGLALCYERSEADTEADALSEYVKKMHIDTDWLRREIAAESDAGAMFNSSKLKFDRAGGPAFEFKTNTPIAHADFHRVGLAMWHLATTVGEDRWPPPVTHSVFGAAEVHQRPVAMKLSSRSGVIAVNGVVVLCKVDSAARCVVTFASTLAVAGSSAFVLREHGWMIFAPHDADAAKSVFQVFYRLESEVRTAHELTAADLAARQSAVKALSDNIKFFLTDVQHMFGEHSDFFDLSRFPVSCPLHKSWHAAAAGHVLSRRRYFLLSGVLLGVANMFVVRVLYLDQPIEDILPIPSETMKLIGEKFSSVEWSKRVRDE